MIDTCVCCGGYVPEGSMVCSLCLSRYVEKEGKTHAGNEPDDLAGLRHYPSRGAVGFHRKIKGGKRYHNDKKTGRR